MASLVRYRIKPLLILSIVIICTCMLCVAVPANAAEGPAGDSDAFAQDNPADAQAAQDQIVIEKETNAGNASQGDSASRQDTMSPTGRVASQKTTPNDQTSTSLGAPSGNSGDSAKPQAPAEKEELTLKPTKAGWYEKEKGVWYYFTSLDAAPKTGWLYTAGAWYWLEPSENGKMANDAWIDDAGKKYYVAASGAMKTGWHKDGVRDGHDVWYWLDASGAVHEGWALVGGSWYYLDPADGGVMRTGRYRAGNVWYVSAPSGAMYANGWAPLGADWYYASASGALRTGWVYTGSWYYLDPAADGKMSSEAWVDDAGKRYYVAASGAMETGWHKDGVRDGYDVWYWLDASGAVHRGWALVGGTWYYLDPADGGVMRTGRYRAGNVWYVSAPSGAMYANGWAPLGSDWYYASASGALASGWVCPGGTWYYLNPKDGNVMLHDCIETIDGDRYSFAHSGAMHANCQIKLEDDKCGYAASSGRITQIGVFKDGSVVLQDVKGNPLKRGWHALAGKWFYSADDAGSMKTGWLQDGGRWYWLESDGAMATSAWVDGGKYYVGADGVWASVNIIQDIRWQLSHGSKPAQYQKYIVLHDTEGGGSPQNVIEGWASNGQRVAAHFVVGKDGTVVQCVPMDNIAHHAGYGNRGYNAQFGVPEDGRDDKRGTSSYDYGMNGYSIGIELVHEGWSGERYPEAQLGALDRLIAYIDSYYGFQSTIIDHKMWAYGNSDTSAEFAGYLANYRSKRAHR